MMENLQANTGTAQHHQNSAYTRANRQRTCVGAGLEGDFGVFAPGVLDSTYCLQHRVCALALACIVCCLCINTITNAYISMCSNKKVVQDENTNAPPTQCCIREIRGLSCALWNTQRRGSAPLTQRISQQLFKHIIHYITYLNTAGPGPGRGTCWPCGSAPPRSPPSASVFIH